MDGIHPEQRESLNGSIRGLSYGTSRLPYRFDHPGHKSEREHGWTLGVRRSVWQPSIKAMPGFLLASALDPARYDGALVLGGAVYHVTSVPELA
jgi:hypothetical protein